MASNRVNTNNVNVETVVLDGVTNLVRRLGRNTKGWTGTMTELNSALVSVVGRKNARVLPGSPSALRVVLNRVVTRLRKTGVSVRFGRTTDHSRTRFVRFSQ